MASEFTTKAATPHGDSKELSHSLRVEGLNQVAARVRVYRAKSYPLRDHVYSHRPQHLRSLFRCETPVVERSVSGYRIAPSHLIFTEPTLPRAAARLAVTSPLSVKPRRHRAWRSHFRHRVRKRSSPSHLFLSSAPPHDMKGAPTGATTCGNAEAASHTGISRNSQRNSVGRIKFSLSGERRCVGR
jgi:hypothetical protein